MSKTIQLTVETFDAEVAESSIPVIIDFWAQWCGPCRALAPSLETIAEEFEGKIKVCKVNIEDAKALASKFKVQSIPTVVAFKDGAEIDRVVGNMPAKIKEMAQGLL